MSSMKMPRLLKRVLVIIFSMEPFSLNPPVRLDVKLTHLPPRICICLGGAQSSINSPEALILAGTRGDLPTLIPSKMEYDIINEPSMSLDVKRQYDFGVVVPFKWYIKYRFEEINNSVINLKINEPCKSLLHVLVFAIDPNDQKDVAVEGKPNQPHISVLTTQYPDMTSRSLIAIQQSQLASFSRLNTRWSLIFEGVTMTHFMRTGLS